MEEFNERIIQIKEILNNLKKKLYSTKPIVLRSRAFIFHYILCIERGANYGCRCKYKTVSVGLGNEGELIRVMKLVLNVEPSQVIPMPTGDSAMLDFLFKKYMALLSNKEVEKESISDHNCNFLYGNG